MKVIAPCGGFSYDNSIFSINHNNLSLKPILERVSDYLYETEYATYNYEDGFDYVNKFKLNGMCSALRKGNIVGRNLDWYYGNEVNVIVKTKACQGRYATIGIAHSALTKAQVDNDEWSDYYNVLPFMVGDCINEHGVYASLNVVVAGNKGYTTGINPEKQDLCQFMIPRYVCDYAKTAEEAIELLDNMNIFAPLDNFGMELHFMICDKDNTYIVEFVDNQMKVHTDTNILTNFYIDGWSKEIKAVFLGDSEQEVKKTGLTLHAMGLERYKILQEGYENITSEADMKTLLEQVKYTLTYDETQYPIWYSEFVEGDLTIYSSAEDYTEIIGKARAIFNERNRDNKNIWYSCYSVIYDLNSKKISVFSEEDFDNKFEFKMKIAGHLE